ncbi:MAG TPA: hypothetical protein VN114_12020 [Oxalicibacterium sp.]|nr:hypothetical protein [Oxalicibacterium sp.]HWU99232.1 hypothetical protein [Oxalicibacterium sp.]
MLNLQENDEIDDADFGKKFASRNDTVEYQGSQRTTRLVCPAALHELAE